MSFLSSSVESITHLFDKPRQTYMEFLKEQSVPESESILADVAVCRRHPDFLRKINISQDVVDLVESIHKFGISLLTKAKTLTEVREGRRYLDHQIQLHWDSIQDVRTARQMIDRMTSYN